MTGPPIAQHAPGDLRIRGAPVAVYWYILQSGLLGFLEFTELKSTSVAHGVHIDERTARLAIRRLVACGYIEEQLPRPHPTSPGRYRLRWGGRPMPNSQSRIIARRAG